jgi:type III secretion protein C
MRVRRHRAAVGVRCVVVVGIVLHASLGHGVKPVWRPEAMHYFARDTPLPEVLREVVSAGGLQVQVAAAVKDPVNGAFNEAPERVFASLIEAYGLAWYFDGHVVHVSRASDIRSRTIAFAPMTRKDVVNLLSSLGLDDSHLPVRYSDTTAIVSGPNDYISAISDAVAQAQEQAAANPAVSEMAIRVFPLHYAQAQDITYTSGNKQQVVPGVASLLRKLMADVPFAEPVAQASLKMPSPRHEARGGPSSLPGLRGLGLADVTPAADVPLPDPGAIRTVAAPMRRNIVADPRTNSIVIYDLPSMMATYERTIATLDRPQDLVEITAAVIDVSSDAARDLGIRFGGGAKGSWGGVSGSTGGQAQPMNGIDLPVMPRNNLATMIGGSAVHLFAKIHALEQHGKARILSRPQVMTMNNTEAVLSSRDSVYVRVAGNQDVDLYNVDTGLTLKVTPTVEATHGETKKILLSVQIEDGAFDANASVDGIPKVSRNSIMTQAVIEDGQSLLVGGYEYERKAKSTSGVPGLSSLPLVGGLFTSKQEETQRVERLILITPRIKSMTNLAARAAGVGERWPGKLTRPVGRTGPVSASDWADSPPPLPPDMSPRSSATKRGGR